MAGIQDKAFNLDFKTTVDQIGQQWLQFDAWLHRPWGLRWCVGRRRQGGQGQRTATGLSGPRGQTAPALTDRLPPLTLKLGTMW